MSDYARPTTAMTAAEVNKANEKLWGNIGPAPSAPESGGSSVPVYKGAGADEVDPTQSDPSDERSNNLLDREDGGMDSSEFAEDAGKWDKSGNPIFSKAEMARAHAKNEAAGVEHKKRVAFAKTTNPKLAAKMEKGGPFWAPRRSNNTNWKPKGYKGDDSAENTAVGSEALPVEDATLAERQREANETFTKHTGIAPRPDHFVYPRKATAQEALNERVRRESGNKHDSVGSEAWKKAPVIPAAKMGKPGPPGSITSGKQPKQKPDPYHDEQTFQPEIPGPHPDRKNTKRKPDSSESSKTWAVGIPGPHPK
jgi:hypothetical protein